MQKRLYRFMLLCTMFVTIFASALTTTSAYADDGTPTAEPSTPTTDESQTVDQAAPTQTVEEIITQVPDGTDIVVVSDQGVEPLATEEAAQVILQSDPIWCPGSATPDDPSCTASASSVTQLISYLGSKSGSGTIYFTSTYSANDAAFDHTNANLASLTDITFQGGWNGATDNTFTISGNTTFSGVPLAVTNWTGNVTLNNIIVDSVSGNTGIYVGTTGNISLTDTSSTNNGFDGADLVNYSGSGDVSVTNGAFSGNNSTGLYIISSGNVDVNNATVNNNTYGANIDNADGTGNVNLNGSTFNNNSSTGLQVKSAGDITLDNVSANNNFIGAYLNALDGTGSVSIGNNSTFSSNQEWGLKTFAKDGDITLDKVTVDGNENGAWLKSFNGNVFVSNSVFSNNSDVGLLAVAGGQVDLTNVTLSDNGGNGGEVYSLYNFACFGANDITVNVDGGAYTGNAGYGLYIEPGSAGIVNQVTAPSFTPANGLDNIFVNSENNPCLPPSDDGDSDEGKPSKIVDIPETGQINPEPQDCENFSGTTLRLPNGTSVDVKCPFLGNSHVTDLPKDNLPGPLPNGLSFGGALNVELDNEGNPVSVLDEGGLLTISFTIPEELIGKHLSILYWDPTANDGQGGWIELPLEQFGGQYFPLYPDKPDDGREICSGLEQSGNTVSVTLNFPGIFTLVAR